MNNSVKSFANGSFLAMCLGLMLAQAAQAEKNYIEITRPVQTQQRYAKVTTTLAPAQQSLMVMPTQQRFVVLEQPVVVEKTRTQNIQKVEQQDRIKIPVVFMGEGSNSIFLCAPPGAKPYPRSGW